MSLELTPLIEAEDREDPPYDHPGYRSTELRAPKRLYLLPEEWHDPTGPVFGESDVDLRDADLTRQHDGEPLGERIVVSGRVLDSGGKPIASTLVEVWQANAGGRYHHVVDQHPAPLDPNFTGAGRCLTDDEGRYRFVTVKPGAYPWGNHENAWRPAHIHFSIFGKAFLQRLVTQMYFPGDPLLDEDPMYTCVPDERARRRLVSALDWETTIPEIALGYRWDVVLRGADETPMEHRKR
jgi:protocatechuate 3,4-dioxygenase, beta subunit